MWNTGTWEFIPSIFVSSFSAVAFFPWEIRNFAHYAAVQYNVRFYQFEIIHVHYFTWILRVSWIMYDIYQFLYLKSPLIYRWAVLNFFYIAWHTCALMGDYTCLIFFCLRTFTIAVKVRSMKIDIHCLYLLYARKTIIICYCYMQLGLEKHCDTFAVYKLCNVSTIIQRLWASVNNTVFQSQRF